MKIKILAIMGSFLLGISHTALGVGSLCNENENVYFSCRTANGKILSLCGNVFTKDQLGDVVEFDNQWLQYRFGSPTTVELSYPRQKRNSITHFKAERISAQGGEIQLDAVVFVSGGIGYSVESDVPRSGRVEGVSVGDPKEFGIEKRGKRRKHYPKTRILCAENANTENFFELVNYLAEFKHIKVTSPRIALDVAIKKGVIRKATPNDATAWLDAFRKKWARLNLPPPGIEESAVVLKTEIHHAYVVLKEFTYPPGLENENRAIFFIPDGVPQPSGKYGHSEIFDFATLSVEFTAASPRGLKW